MAKIKTNRSISKRFKRTGNGKLKRTKGFKNHILTKKPSKRKNKLAKGGYVRPETAQKLKPFISR